MAMSLSGGVAAMACPKRGNEGMTLFEALKGDGIWLRAMASDEWILGFFILRSRCNADGCLERDVGGRSGGNRRYFPIASSTTLL